MIRKAESRDIESLAILMGELGYPTSPDEMEKRMERINNQGNYLTLVCEKDKEIIGMIGMMHCFRYEKTDSYVRIVAYVVDGRFRGRGIGKELLNEAEEWAHQNDAVMVTLNSGNRSERDLAHQFYINQGFEASATGFYKKLS
ncbi:GNAT family N-acetyltransferase [Halalkalibacillus sediminis]|uniref:GNAT family N-acetyltransferase n=1 Tax=Halalkalibacillus sediminis TaxID=2018042 RepID=A0A2I0QSM5_9BACI|nr:GNAT family N-acetyltransferase [Halalkalibacillus sediminis]PKR77110.1 GNAT family N-acetyltransferase [Halalkalibacillus sediminis]